jgi:predicted ester cyclase
MIAPTDIRAFLGELFGAFPDLRYELLEVTAADGRAAVRWRARGTFAAPGAFQGFVANGARLGMEGRDVLTVSAEDRIEHLDAYLDSGDVARQLGVLPPAGSRAEARLTQLANARTRARSWIQGPEPERIADADAPT